MIKSEHTANLALATAKPLNTSALDKVGKNFANPIPRLQKRRPVTPFFAMGNKYK